MIKRALAALAAATVALTLLGAPAAQAAGPTGKPRTDCVWMWTAQGPACHWQ